jgi:hypothetical protein
MQKICLVVMLMLAGVRPPYANAQTPTKPLFPGAEHLDSCVVELPLTYAKKDKERYTQAARFLEDVELIYLSYDKKTKAATYTRVYVITETKDGGDLVYIENAKDHLQMDGVKQAFFPKFKASSERFYNADCFDAHVGAHPGLKEVLKEAQP